MAEGSRDAPTKPDLPASARRESYTLEARFEHIREIARGGMGRVVEARDRQLGRIVAVKESLDNHPDSLLRFEREVAITARLEHPSIVPVYDAGIAADGTPFYVMRRVSGAPFDQLIRRSTTLDKRLTLLPHVLAVADAIAHAHQRGVIHRDIKPSNVLVGELGETVVIDWGLAKMLDEDDAPGTATRARGALETAAGAVIGTPGFMAPEQVTAGITDARTDVYALGACLYYLLAGRTPFHGSSEDDVLDRTRRGALDPLERGVPRDLMTIVTKAMATDPSARYIDAGGFSEDLRRFLGGQLVAAHRYPPLQRIVRWVSRHRTAAVAILGVAIAATVTGVLVRRLGDERARTESKSDDVVIVQATELVADDPTRAIAMLQQLRPDSPRWPSLAPLLADARARGIAVGFPGDTHADLVRFSPGADDTRILTSGAGMLRLTDLAARTSRVLAEGSQGMQGWWCGALVLYNPAVGQPLRLLDPTTNATFDIPWPEKQVYAASANGVVAFIDAQQRVVTLDAPGLPTTAQPSLVAGASPASYVELSPSGKWMLVSTMTSTQLFVRDGAWKHVADYPELLHEPTFDAREERLAVRTGDQDPLAIVELELASGRELRRWSVPSSFDLAYAGTELYLAGFNEVVRLVTGGKTVHVTRLDAAARFVFDNAGEWLAILEAPRRILMLRGTFRRTIRSPIDLAGVVADPHGRHVVGLAGGMSLGWDLSPIVPQRIELEAETIVFHDTDSILTTNMDKADLGKRVDNYRFTPTFGVKAQATLGKIPPVGELFVLPGGVIVARDHVAGQEHVFEAPLEGRTDLTAIAVIDSTAFVVGTNTSRIERIDRNGGPATLIATLDTPIVSIAANAGWIAAQSVDGTLFRRGGGRESRTTVDTSTVGIDVAEDGTVYIPRGTQLLGWGPTAAAPVPVASIAPAITTLRVVTGGRVATIGKDHSMHVYDPVTRTARLVADGTFGTLGLDLDISQDGTLAATRIDRALAVVQLATSARWTIADRLETQALALSPEGRYLIASDVVGPALYRFDLTLPPASAAWVKAATNALPPRTPNAVLEWRPLP